MAKRERACTWAGIFLVSLTMLGLYGCTSTYGEAQLPSLAVVTYSSSTHSKSDAWLLESPLLVSEERIGPAPKPRYHAVIEPKLEPDTAYPGHTVLIATGTSRLSFDISLETKKDDLLESVIADSLRQAKKDVRLSVMLTCGFCVTPGALQRMVYRTAEQQASAVEFELTPKAAKNGKAYDDTFYLTVVDDTSGREYDRMSIPVLVKPATAKPASSAAPEAIALTSSPLPDDGLSPDVILYVTQAESSHVMLSLEPVSPAMKSALGTLAYDVNGKRNIFRTGIDDEDQVKSMANSAYGAMSALSLQSDDLIGFGSGAKRPIISPASLNSATLTDNEKNRVSNAIAVTGKSLYRTLFYGQADQDLSPLIDALEQVAIKARNDSKARPVRLTIYSGGITLPWQYLHRVGKETDSSQFWGILFSINVARTDRRLYPRPTAAEMARAGKTLFALHASSADPTYKNARSQIQQLKSMPVPKDELIAINSGSGFLDTLDRDKDKIGSIVTFLHASSSDPKKAPFLEFNSKDIVTSDSLMALKNDASPAQQRLRYLSGAPLVILNACETGPSRNLPFVSMEKVMTELGAGGVIVTEVSVWNSLGNEMANSLIGRLADGMPAADALTLARRDLLAQKNNPLGLFYSYYGEIAASTRWKH